MAAAFRCNSPYDYSGLDLYLTDISPDLVFLSNETREFHILPGSPGSPCKDQGTNKATQSDKDIDGRSRIYNGTIDIGADEWDTENPSLAATKIKAEGCFGKQRNVGEKGSVPNTPRIGVSTDGCQESS